VKAKLWGFRKTIRAALKTANLKKMKKQEKRTLEKGPQKKWGWAVEISEKYKRIRGRQKGLRS